MNTKLFPEERYRQILAALDQTGRISVEDLSRRFGISQVTIRSDLQYLASQKLLLRTHGGAIQVPSDDEELNFSSRIEQHSPEKDQIGRVAAAMVKDGEIVGLDASTTALAIASHLSERADLTIVTNGLALANRMLQVPGITLYLVGGFLRRDALSLVGSAGLEILPELHIHRYFFSAHGLTISEGLTEMSAQEGATKEYFIHHAQHVVAVMDSSKIGRASLHAFAPLRNIHSIITDANAPDDYLEKIRAAGIDVIIA